MTDLYAEAAATEGIDSAEIDQIERAARTALNGAETPWEAISALTKTMLVANLPQYKRTLALCIFDGLVQDEIDAAKVETRKN